MKSITIASYKFNLNASYSISLFFVDINNVILEWVSVQYSSGIGLLLYNGFDVLITNLTFANNGDPKTNVGNGVIYYDDQVKKLSRVNVVKSNFTLGLRSCMTLVYDVDNEIEVEVMIENSEFSHNIVQYGGGVYIYLHNGSGNIEFSNCTIYNNIAWNGGAVRVFIELYDKSGSSEFSNCTIYFELHNGSGSIEFSNCTIYIHNTAWSGGGVLIELYDGIASTEFSNCTIYNNTAWYGSGLLINALECTSTSRIHFTNVSFQFNKLPDQLNIY